jgi:polyisoprenoid-binding protein YceI
MTKEQDMAEAPITTFDGAVLVRDTSATGTWRIDTGSSRVELAVKHLWGLIAVRGRFRAFAGTARVTADGKIIASLSIDAASIDTRQKQRDKHLRSADFLDVERHPTIEVQARDVRLESGHAASVVADVVVAGIAKTMTFDVEFALSEGGQVATVDTVVVVDRAGFGMTWNPMRAAAETAEVTAHLVFSHSNSDH